MWLCGHLLWSSASAWTISSMPRCSSADVSIFYELLGLRSPFCRTTCTLYRFMCSTELFLAQASLVIFCIFYSITRARELHRCRLPPPSAVLMRCSCCRPLDARRSGHHRHCAGVDRLAAGGLQARQHPAAAARLLALQEPVPWPRPGMTDLHRQSGQACFNSERLGLATPAAHPVLG